MSQIELVIGLMLAVVVLATVAERIKIPYPVVLVIGGLVLGALPQLPNVQLDPDTVFLLFLPPALFSAALSTDWPRFRDEIRPIFALAVNLVLTTLFGVAVVAFAVMNHMSWDVAFVLGAVVSPPDAVATLAIVQRLKVPRKLVTILEGESLINDVTALVAYRFAVAAVVTGSFSIWAVGLDFVYSAVVGLVIGLAVSLVISWFIGNFVDDPTIANVVSCLTPVVAFYPAEHLLHASGVLAVVTAGLVFARGTSQRLTAATRLQADVVWHFVMFIIDGLVFILIGLQLPTVIDGLSQYSWPQLIFYGASVSIATILIRVIFVGLILNPRRPFPILHFETSGVGWRAPAVIAWAGPRGILTLGTALALPYTTDAGLPFPDRDLVIFLAFCVILSTLMGQGLTLAPLIKRLRFPDDDTKEKEARLAARAVIIAGIHRLDELEEEYSLPDGSGDVVRAALKARLLRYPLLDHNGGDGATSTAQRRIVQEVTSAQRAELNSMQERGLIGEAARRTVERELDLTEARVLGGGSSH